ncbi:MAG: hypothetical protein KIG68_09525 [Oxalobacter sp.]|nr:hypothetical protein [Oxalobacter sp.]
MTDISVSGFAREVGMSRANIRRLIDIGAIPRNSDGTIPLEEGLRAFENRKGGKKSAKPSSSDIRDKTAQAKLAKETYTAKLKELDYRHRKGELIEASDVAAEAQRVAGAVLDKLRSVAPRCAVICEGRPAREIESIIDDAINEALAELQTCKFK